MPASSDDDQMGSVEDDRLVEQALRGQRDAAERLVRRHLGRVYGLAVRMLGNHHDAEDATQQTMLKTVQALPRYRMAGTFVPWLLKITSNTCLSMLRNRQPVVPSELHEGLLPAANTPEDDTNERRLAQIERLLSELPDQQRAIFVLFHYDGRSLREVAEVLDIPEGTVRSSLHRARAKLRHMITVAEEGCHT